MTIRSEEKLLESFKKIIDSSQYCLINKKIQKHPHSAKEKKMLRFEKKLKVLLKTEKNKKNISKKFLNFYWIHRCYY